MKDATRPRGPGTAPGGDAVYAIGMVGALVWYWRQAENAQGRIKAVPKAFVWPAFLVYEAFKALGGRMDDGYSKPV